MSVAKPNNDIVVFLDGFRNKAKRSRILELIEEICDLDPSNEKALFIAAHVLIDSINFTGKRKSKVLGKLRAIDPNLSDAAQDDAIKIRIALDNESIASEPVPLAKQAPYEIFPLPSEVAVTPEVAKSQNEGFLHTFNEAYPDGYESAPLLDDLELSESTIEDLNLQDFVAAADLNNPYDAIVATMMSLRTGTNKAGTAEEAKSRLRDVMGPAASGVTFYDLPWPNGSKPPSRNRHTSKVTPS